ncbi:hypothetical protein D3OALGA1CA_1797 [Olavius algarvensis associated proteobacterium Delta 3]|nr:hypothetical protein D3OALGA1CA_1797 [Olavius algarvensis associated proteobacterium Delta 3]CAB5136482.1 hypothetical protein D3OALGB2SA_3966 [Olavius algarvensis associated proteobacterium Delta 3]
MQKGDPMTIDRSKRLIIIALILLVGVGWYPSVVAGNTLMMSVEDLKDRIGDPDTMVLDVRTGSDWSASNRKIKGALRFDPNKFSSWAGILPKGKTIVFY